MIHHALQIIRDELQQCIGAKLKPQSKVTYASLANPTNDQGEPGWPANALALSLVNVEEERILRNQAPVVCRDGDQAEFATAPLKLHLYLLVSANFNEYIDSLRYLAYAMSFFQTKAVFNHQNAPGMHADLEQLNLELHSLTFEQLNQLWGALGAKYVPSALYVVKLVCLGEDQVEMRGPRIVRPDYRGRGMG